MAQVYVAEVLLTPGEGRSLVVQGKCMIMAACNLPDGGVGEPLDDFWGWLGLVHDLDRSCTKARLSDLTGCCRPCSTPCTPP